MSEPWWERLYREWHEDDGPALLFALSAMAIFLAGRLAWRKLKP